MRTGKLFFEKRIALTGIVYFIAAFLLLYIFDIQTGGEAEKYIDNANRILKVQGLRNGFFGLFYVVYSALVSLFVWLHINLVFLAVVQLIVSFISALCLYKLLLEFWQHKNIAFVFFVIYLLCYPIQRWNFYLYSDGLHSSLVVIGIYLFFKLLKEPNRVRWFSFALMILLIVFSRPTGLLFVMGGFMVFLIWLYRRKQRIAFNIFLIIGIVAIITVLNSPLTAFINPDSIKRMEVICQVPETNTDTAYQEFNRAGLIKAFTVIKEEVGIGNFIKTGFRKLGYFFGMYRSYYSWQNNLLLLLYIIFYPLAVIGLFSKQRNSFYYVKLLSAIYLLLTAMAIFFTCDDWANRFISPAFPFIIILASAGFLKLHEKFKVSN
jgi:hypothetical protein